MLTRPFFGHKDTDEKVEPILKTTLIDLIENKNKRVINIAERG